MFSKPVTGFRGKNKQGRVVWLWQALTVVLQIFPVVHEEGVLEGGNNLIRVRPWKEMKIRSL